MTSIYLICHIALLDEAVILGCMCACRNSWPESSSTPRKSPQSPCPRRKVSSQQSFSASLHRSVILRIGIVENICWIAGSGFHPTKTSNLPRATAISGLWLASPNFSGSCLWKFAARSLSGWIWSGKALSMDRI